jgi:hypothetical protein
MSWRAGPGWPAAAPYKTGWMVIPSADSCLAIGAIAASWAAGLPAGP